MKLKAVCLTAIAVGLAAAVTSRANVVYVSESAADVTWSQLGAGYNGQDGLTPATAFGSIQAAYHSLFYTTGNHEIRLIGDGDGIFGGSEIGVNEGTFSNIGDGYIRLLSGTANAQQLNGDPRWTSVKLVSDSTRVTLSMTRNDITGPTEADATAYPAAYEKEIVNPTGTFEQNRGGVIRGLFNPGASMALTGMIIENVNITLGGGHVLVGTTASDGSGGIQQQFTFNNVGLELQREVVDIDLVNGLPANTTGSPWGRSALFVSHMTQADLDNSSLDFNNSNIYLVNDDGSAWSGNFYVGTGWGTGVGQNYEFAAGMIDGNNTSGLYYWNGSEYVEWSDLNDGIWQSGRNANTLTAYENGVGGANEFLVNFNIPEPNTALMVALATVALALTGRRRRA